MMAALDEPQVVASVGATICAGASFFLWLRIISRHNPIRISSLRQRPVILAQAVVGILILTGLLVSVTLAIYQPNLRGGEQSSFKYPFHLLIRSTDPSRPVLAIEVGFLLLLPTINEVQLLSRLDYIDILKSLSCSSWRAKNTGRLIVLLWFRGLNY